MQTKAPQTAIELFDARGQRVSIPRDEIEEFLPSPNSLMPVGFEKQIQPKGFADLLAFLTARGTVPPGMPKQGGEDNPTPQGK